MNQCIWNRFSWAISLSLVLASCGTVQPTVTNSPVLMGKVSLGMPAIDDSTSIYELPVNDGVSYQDVIDSLKSVSEGKNFVNPANFPIAEHIKKRGIDPQGIKEVHSFCNLSLGTDIFLDHPEFLVFAPCRIAIYEKPDANKKLKLSNEELSKKTEEKFEETQKNNQKLNSEFANLSKIEFQDRHGAWLDTITTFNLNTRYDSYKQEFYKKCTLKYTKEWIENINELRSWIKMKL